MFAEYIYLSNLKGAFPVAPHAEWIRWPPKIPSYKMGNALMACTHSSYNCMCMYKEGGDKLCPNHMIASHVCKWSRITQWPSWTGLIQLFHIRKLISLANKATHVLCSDHIEIVNLFITNLATTLHATIFTQLTLALKTIFLYAMLLLFGSEKASADNFKMPIVMEDFLINQWDCVSSRFFVFTALLFYKMKVDVTMTSRLCLISCT